MYGCLAVSPKLVNEGDLDGNGTCEVAEPGKTKGTILIHYPYEGYDPQKDSWVNDVRDTICFGSRSGLRRFPGRPRRFLNESSPFLIAEAAVLPSESRCKDTASWRRMQEMS